MIDPLRALLFISLTAVAVVASLHSWRTRQAYGWFRFMAFEGLAVLVAWNARRWFHNPDSTRQIISWALFVTAAALTIHGIYAYDAYLIACAEKFRLPLLTLDRGLMTVARDTGVKLIEVTS